ncbi:MAG: hypothetical protein AAFN44_08420 [Pseudomonadota bacterium]
MIRQDRLWPNDRVPAFSDKTRWSGAFEGNGTNFEAAEALDMRLRASDV